MDQSADHKPDVGMFRPEGEMTIYTAIETKARLMEALSSCKTLELDLSRVTEMDTAGLQLLLLAAAEAQRRNIGFSIGAHSAAARDTLDLCNLTGMLGSPAVSPNCDLARSAPA
jgi:anti-sigma B factor antagonist